MEACRIVDLESRSRCSEWRHCVVVRRKTPLLRRICSVVSYTTAGTETRRVRLVRVPAAWTGTCNSLYSCLVAIYSPSAFRKLFPELRVQSAPISVHVTQPEEDRSSHSHEI